ncbi:MAG: transglutaminase-like domain-containing protein [Holophagales bacterium]|nr:transglutaminase-like domain-containing protein [Holophagales bacterium]
MWSLVLLGLLLWTAGSVPALVEGASSRGAEARSSALWIPQSARERLGSIRWERLPSASARLRALHHLIVSRRGLGVREQPGRSGTAAEVIRWRRADCVGFAVVLVGLAREAGLPAVFALERSAGRRLDPAALGPSAGPLLEGVARVREEHMVAWLPDGDGSAGGWAVDFSGAYRAEERFVPIPDRTAEAILWSNRGAYSLFEGRCRDARRWAARAARLSPGFASVRGNQRAVERACAQGFPESRPSQAEGSPK